MKIGKNVTNIEVGDHVATFVHGSKFADEGSFAEYVKTPAELAWVVPANTLTFEQSATYNVACVPLSDNS